MAYEPVPLRPQVEQTEPVDPVEGAVPGRADESALAEPEMVAAERGDADEDRPLTLGETLDHVRAWYARVRGTWWERALVGVLLAALGALAWLVLSLVIPWSDGIIGSVQGVLALDVPWAPVPAPDDPAVAADAGLGTAAWIGAPLVIAAFWFAAAYHLDRASRRVLGVSHVPGVRHSAGYVAMAMVVVFPLIILGLISGAWGIFALTTWAVARGAWGSVVALIALLVAFCGLVRLASAVLERRAANR